MIIALISFLTFLFVFYTLAKEDFLYIRKNVTIEQLFNAIFIGLPVALLFARIFFVAFHFKWTYLNPLVFFALPYFPGFSLSGGIFGAVIFLYFYTKNKKITSLHFADELGLALLGAMAMYFLILAVEQGIHHQTIGILSSVLAIFYIVGFILTKKLLQIGKWLDGTIAACCLFLLALFSLLRNMVMIFLTKKIIVSFDDIAVFVIFILSTVVFIYLRMVAKKQG